MEARRERWTDGCPEAVSLFVGRRCTGVWTQREAGRSRPEENALFGCCGNRGTRLAGVASRLAGDPSAADFGVRGRRQGGRGPTADELPANLLSSGQTEAGDPKQDAKELAKQVYGKPLSSTDLRDTAHNMFGKKRGDRAYSELTENTNRYGIATQRVLPTNKIVYGTLAGVEAKK